MTFYTFLLHLHSIFRYVALFLIIWAVFVSFKGYLNKQNLNTKSLRIALYTLIAFHIQFLGGAILYFVSPKVMFNIQVMKISMLRFFTVEHFLLMTIAVVLITIGYSKSKKNLNGVVGYRNMLIYYSIALLLIIVAIPWPFRTALYSNWF